MSCPVKPKHPLIVEFISEIAQQRKWSIRTANTATFRLNNLVKVVGKEPTEITEQDIMEFIKAKQKGENWNSSSPILNGLWIMRLFYKFLHKKGLVPNEYKLKIKVYKELPRDIGREIFVAVRKQKNIVDKYSVNIRSKALWYLLYLSTASLADIVKLKVKNVNFEHNYIAIDNAKDGALPYVILQRESAQMLKLYLAKVKIESEYLFPQATDNSKPISYNYIRAILRQISFNSGIRITSRERTGLKFSIAVKAGVDIHTLQCMFGVKNLATFQKYLDEKNTKLRPFKEMRKLNNFNKKHRFI